MNGATHKALLAIGFGILAAPLLSALVVDSTRVRAAAELRDKARAAEQAEEQARTLVAMIKAAESELGFTAVRALTAHDPSGTPVTVVQRVYGARGPQRKIELVTVEGAAPRKERLGSLEFSFLFLQHIQAAVSGPGLRPSGIINKFGDPDLVARNYDFRKLATEEVAGRRADVHEITPRHPGRSSFRVWTDRVNRFPLRWQVWSDGVMVFEATHRSIEFATPDVKFPKTRGEFLEFQRNPLENDAEIPIEVKFNTFLPKTLPDGMVRTDLVSVRARVPGMDDTFQALTARYTDGLAAVSLLEVDANHKLVKQIKLAVLGMAEPPAIGRGQIIAQRVSGRGGAAIRLNIEGTEIILSGSVSPAELEKVVRSLVKTGGME